MSRPSPTYLLSLLGHSEGNLSLHNHTLLVKLVRMALVVFDVKP